MIVVTGPGRSGTSLVAQLYHELGFDPGGLWNPRARAGFEDRTIVRMNHALIRDLGMRSSGRQFRFVPDDRVPGRLKGLAKRVVPPAAQDEIRSLLRDPPWRARRRMDVIQWERFTDVTRLHGEDLRRLAAERSVAKDPAFCWTLGVWVAAQAQIDHVLVTVRSLDAMAKSRLSQHWLSPRSLGPVKNWMGYGLGLVMATVYDARLSHSILRFPDFLSQPEVLYESMHLPPEVTFGAFSDAFHTLVRHDFVHDLR
jgi:hypothetical protein